MAHHRSIFAVSPPEAASAESIYSSIVDCLEEKNLQISRIVGMFF